MFESILNPIFSPLLRLPPLLAIFIISLFLTVIIILLYKKLTDQKLMKDLKDELKSLNKQVKELKNHPKEMMKVQKKAMEINMKYMMHSLKPTLWTFLPIILIFGWLNVHMAYYPIVQGQQFSVTMLFKDGTSGNATIQVPDGIILLNNKTLPVIDNKVIWFLKANSSGEYTLTYSFKGKNITQPIIITKDDSIRLYKKPELTSRDFDADSIEKIVVSNKKIKPLKNIPLINQIPWINNFGWLGTYILFSIILNSLLRKLLKVY